MQGIHAYATYVPHSRLARKTVATELGIKSKAGIRAVASYDEDTTTMAVEAGRRALDASRGPTPATLCFATTAPAYVDRTNAAGVHAALGLSASVIAYDFGAAPRSGSAALVTAGTAGSPFLVLLADTRGGRPGSDDELLGGDAAAAFVFGPAEGSLAEVIGRASLTAEVLDRWAAPGDTFSQTWEERFTEALYTPLIRTVADQALIDAGVEQPDHVLVSASHRRVVASGRKVLGAASEAFPDAEIGYAGTADVGLQLAATLGIAGPDETILVIAAADGVDALVFRTTDALAAFREGVSAVELPPALPINYTTYLTWRGAIHREPPRRPDPVPTASPPAARGTRWKYGFVGSRCRVCSTVHLPPQRVCSRCSAVDKMDPAPMSRARGTVKTFTIDLLAPSLAPPVVDVVIDFDEGGRFQCEMTDVDADSVAVGDRIEMTFRYLGSANGVRNYFWKARPIGATTRSA